MFLLLFASNAIVPVSSLPGWLQAFARDQPLGVTTSAIRELFLVGRDHRGLLPDLLRPLPAGCGQVSGSAAGARVD
jgi:ABC-2 type transport system permease protein/oleandomycin transport system permease protein